MAFVFGHKYRKLAEFNVISLQRIISDALARNTSEELEKVVEIAILLCCDEDLWLDFRNILVTELMRCKGLNEHEATSTVTSLVRRAQQKRN